MDDLDTAAAVVTAAVLADTGQTYFGADFLRSEWENPNIELAKDTWLVFPEPPGPDSMAVGYAQIIALDQHRRLESMAVVHPGHRGRGIGWYLSDLLEFRAAEHAARAPADGTVVLYDGVAAPDQAGHRLLKERGFVLARHLWRMDMTLTDDLPLPGGLPGIRVRTFQLGRDDRAIHRILQEAFADHWGVVQRGFDEWAAHHIGEQAFDPDLWWVAVDGQEVVGALLGRIADGVSWVRTLGVRGAWRKRGIGEALLRHSFLEFRRRGFDEVRLDVDSENQTGATALYDRVGMHVGLQWDMYEKHLR